MKKLVACFCVVSIMFTACQEGEFLEAKDVEAATSLEDQIIRVNLSSNVRNQTARSGNNNDDPAREFMSAINTALSGQGILLEKIEFLGMGEEGRTLTFFSDRGNKQLTSDFVPNDFRNVGGTAVPYWIDDMELGTSSGMTEQETFDAIVDCMAIWDAETCSQGLDIPFLGTSGMDVGLIQLFMGYGGFDGIIPGTILHGGILPPSFFEDIIGLGGGSGTIGATFTFIWLNFEDGQPSDIDGNGKDDVAFREIYINDNFNFQDAPNHELFEGVVDFETIVLHEVGHGLSQGHFGMAFPDNGHFNIHFAPAALMNAVYSVPRREVTQTDQAGHCSIWADWPNN